jgi:hypothetical protein
LDKQIIEKIKIKQKYNKLVFKITQYELINRKPPEKLLKEAQELARQIDVPEAELRNIEC